MRAGSFGYSVYANRVYLADLRGEFFHARGNFHSESSWDRPIQIKAGKCIEVLSSPYYEPIVKLHLGVAGIARLGSVPGM